MAVGFLLVECCRMHSFWRPATWLGMCLFRRRLQRRLSGSPCLPTDTGLPCRRCPRIGYVPRDLMRLTMTP